ncbi:Aerobic cobaltochelatase CobN subunit, partial [hydrothermal vent metagenome]
MHLLNVQPGAIDDGGEAVDIGQSPADIVILSAADTELATLATAHGAIGPPAPCLRLANLLHLRHPMSVDLYAEQTLVRARIVIVRLLGGRSYWPYGVEQLIAGARNGGFKLMLLPGDDKPDDDLRSASTIRGEPYDRLWAYFVHGGATNARGAIAYAATLIGQGEVPPQAAPLLAAGLYWPKLANPGLAELRPQWQAGRPLAAITFYRALLQSGQTGTIDALIETLASAGLNALPVYAQSFKDPLAADIVARALAKASPQVVINLTGFALSAPGHTHAPTLMDTPGGVVLQAVMAGVSRAAWEQSSRGLGVRDIAMNVALPEIDG